MALKSRRKKPNESEIYCRKCGEFKKESDFYDARDKFIDTNGKMSICSNCIADIFEKEINSGNSFEKSIYNTCKYTNILYKEDCVQNAKTYMNNKLNKSMDFKISKIFGWYITYSGRVLALHPELSGTFECDSVSPTVDAEEELKNETEDIKEYLKMFWGEGDLVWDDYQFLESELARWKETHACDTAAEETLLREICFIQLELKKARQSSKPTETLLKKLTDTMKAAAVDPAKTNALSSGKGSDILGMKIKQIEETEPAELFKDKELYKDFDGLGRYWDDYVVRPIKNFITSSRDFKVEDEFDLEKEDENIEIEE